MAYYYNKKTGELVSVSEYNRRTKEVTGGGAAAGTPEKESEKLLSPAEATSFGVPYGTTKGSVFGKTPTSSGGGTAEERGQMRELQKGTDLLGQIEGLYKNMVGKEYTGTGAGVLGRLKGLGRAIGSATGTHQDARAYQSFVDSNLSLIARGLKGEVGVLTNQDIARAKAAVPKLGSSPKEAEIAFNEIRKQIAANQKLFSQQQSAGGETAAPAVDRQAKIAQLRTEAAAAEKEANRSTTSRFMGEVPGAAARTLLGVPARFIASGLAAPFDVGAQLAGAPGPVVTGNIPFVNKPTFQAEAAQRQGEILDRAAAGQPTSVMDYVNILRPFVEVPLAGLETYALGSTAKSVGTAVARRTPGVRGAFPDVRSARETTKIADELVPKLTPTKYGLAGKKGDVSAPGLFSRGRVSVDSPKVKSSVDAVEGVAADLGIRPTRIIKPGATATANNNNVLNTIEDYSEKVVRPFLSSNQVETNFDDYIRYAQTLKPPRAIRNNPEAARSFENVRERVIEEMYRSVKSQSNFGRQFGAETDPNIYWNARKVIDKIIEEELGAKTFTDTGITGVKAAAQTMRKGTANFLDDLLRYPGQTGKVAEYRQVVNDMIDRGMDMDSANVQALAEQMGLQASGAAQADAWRYFMRNLEGLYGASDNLITRMSAEQGKNLIQIYLQNRPFLRQAGSIAAQGLIGAAVAAPVVGAVYGDRD